MVIVEKVILITITVMMVLVKKQRKSRNNNNNSNILVRIITTVLKMELRILILQNSTCNTSKKTGQLKGRGLWGFV